MEELDARLLPPRVCFPVVFVAWPDHDDHVGGFHQDVEKLDGALEKWALGWGRVLLRRRHLGAAPLQILFARWKGRIV